MRKIILLSSILMILTAIPTFAVESFDYPKKKIQTSFPPGDGKLAIYSYNFNELIDVTYRTGDKYNQKALEQITHIFRSRGDGKEHVIDIELIELLDHLQDYFEANNIELISGYRSPEHNHNLKMNGSNVAENSLHMIGAAADIHIDEVTEEIVAQYAHTLKVGGVGYYPARDFVHVDTGDVRAWNLPDKKGRLLMAFRKGPKWQALTDRDIYLPNENIEYEILNITRTPKKLSTPPQLNFYQRGKWSIIKTLNYPENKTFKAGEKWKWVWKPDKSDLFGKFRIVIPEPKQYPYLEAWSNEFYRKRR